MEQFNALPFPQKIVVLVLVMGTVAGLFYYAMIMPLEEEQIAAQETAKRLETEVQGMRDSLAPDKDRDLEAEKLALETEMASFEQMLPRREDLVKFITGLSDTAKNAGLSLLSFSKGTPNEQNYYLEIPIQMTVRGTYRELLGFLRSLSAPGERVVNIREFEIDRPKLQITRLLAELEAAELAEMNGGQDQDPNRINRRRVRRTVSLSPLHKMMLRVKATEDMIARGVPLEASFTAWVFTYTGEEAGPEAVSRNKAFEAARKEKRKRMLVIL